MGFACALPILRLRKAGGTTRICDCAFSPRMRARGFASSLTPFNQRAQGMPGAGWRPRSRVQIALVFAHTSIQVQPEQPGIPCAMGLRLIPSSPWRRIPFRLHRRRIEGPANPVGSAETSAGLTPATGARTTRLCRPRRAVRLARGLRSQAKARPAKTDCAPGTPRPPLPAPNVRDDRDTPLLRARDGRVVRVIWVNREAEYFSLAGWTRCRAKRKLICPSGSHTGDHIWCTHAAASFLLPLGRRWREAPDDGLSPRIRTSRAET